MSGQEWVPEPADLRGEERPLSPAVGPEPGFANTAYVLPSTVPVDALDPETDPDGETPEVRPRRVGFRFSLPRFRARRDDAAGAEVEEGVVEILVNPHGDPDSELDDDEEAPPTRRRFSFPFRLPSFRRAQSEDLDDPTDEFEEPSIDGDEDEDDATVQPGRFAGLPLSREARVGVAAALSFVILVGVWVNNKGRAPKLALPTQSDVAAEAKPKEGEVAATTKDKEKEKDGAAKSDPKVPVGDPATKFEDGVLAGSQAKPETKGAGAIAHNDPAIGAGLPPAAPVPSPIDQASPPVPTPVPAAAPALAATEGGSLPTAEPASAPMPGENVVELPPSTVVTPPTGPAPITPPTEPTVATEPQHPDVAASAPLTPTVTPEPTPAPAPMPTLPDTKVAAEAAPPEPKLPDTKAVEPPSLSASQPEPPAAPPVTTPTPTAEPELPQMDPRSVPPVPSSRTPPLESVPVVSAPTPRSGEGTAKSSELGDDWIPIKDRSRRVVVSSPLREGADVPIASGVAGAMAGAAVADGPALREDVAARDQVEPRLHKVRSGENFWTISRLYYGTGRYYRALAAANIREVPDIKELYVGTVIRVPPPETLDRALVDPPSRDQIAEKADKTDVSRTSNPGDLDDGAEVVKPRTPTPRRPQREVEAVDEPPTRPTHKVGAHETLRSIARDTLGDSRREREILLLNRNLLRDPADLAPGQTIILPTDAVIGRRGR